MALEVLNYGLFVLIYKLIVQIITVMFSSYQFGSEACEIDVEHRVAMVTTIENAVQFP